MTKGESEVTMDEDYNDQAVLADLYGEDDWYEEDSALWN